MAKKSGFVPGKGLASRPPYMPGLNSPLTPPGSPLKPKKISGLGQGGRPKGQSQAPKKLKIPKTL